MTAMEWCSLEKFEEFWDCGFKVTIEDWYKDRFDRELVEKLMLSQMGINFLLMDDDVKMGCAPEICEYYGLPLPAEAKPERIRKILNKKVLEGWKFCKWLWDDAVTIFPEDADTRDKQFWECVERYTKIFERSVDILEEIAAALVPCAMHAHEKKLETARFRAVYGVVVMKIRHQTSFLRGFKAKVASFQ